MNFIVVAPSSVLSGEYILLPRPSMRSPEVWYVFVEPIANIEQFEKSPVVYNGFKRYAINFKKENEVVPLVEKNARQLIRHLKDNEIDDEWFPKNIYPKSQENKTIFEHCESLFIV